MKKVALLITDLDNTLWDWFAIWHSRFSPLLDALVTDTGISRAQLIGEIKAVHQKHHTTEYSFLLQELPCLEEHLGRKIDVKTDFKRVIEAARIGRERASKMYPSVKETLMAIKESGTRIVAFTESQIYYTTQRIRKFELDGIIDVLYSTPDQGLPDESELMRLRAHPDGYYKLQKTIVRALPDRLTKPSPEILSAILQVEGYSRDAAIYVGDSLTKDIQMALSAKVTPVFAEYGVVHREDAYKLLQEVTHWPDQAVQHEQNTSSETIKAEYVLKASFSELLASFRFIGAPGATSESLVQEIDIWKETVATQRHFNDLQMQLRSILVTLLTAVVGGAGYAMSQHTEIFIIGQKVTLGTVVAMAGIVALVAIHFFDRGYYSLLIGAVKNGLEIEKRLQYVCPGIELAHHIQAESQKLKFMGVFKFSSLWRNRLFYLTCAAVLVILAVASQYSSSVEVDAHLAPGSQLALERYYANRYSASIDQAVRLAISHLDARLAEKPVGPTLICDIDETALSNWPVLTAGHFAHDPVAFAAFAKDGNAEAIQSVLRLYQYARSRGVDVVFLSSRAEDLRSTTEANLLKAGYDSLHSVILKPLDDQGSTQDFKKLTREKLRKEGRSIVLNVGDQMSDLNIPLTPDDFLIPNPFYTAE